MRQLLLVKAATLLDKLEFSGFAWDKVDLVDPTVAMLMADAGATDVVLAEKILSHGLTQGLIKPKSDGSNVAALLASGLGPMGGPAMMPMMSGSAMQGRSTCMGPGGRCSGPATVSDEPATTDAAAAGSCLGRRVRSAPPDPGDGSRTGWCGPEHGIAGPGGNGTERADAGIYGCPTTSWYDGGSPYDWELSGPGTWGCASLGWARGAWGGRG
jgi:hypothetical protein